VKRLEMKLFVVCLVAFLALAAVHGEIAVAPSESAAPIVRSLEDGRSGEIRFISFQPTRQQLDRGSYRQKPVAIRGSLRLPQYTKGRVPAAVLIHGSDGVSVHQQNYADTLVERGMATFVLDSFGPRNVDSTVGQQAAVPSHVMVVDLFASLELLASHPRIDPQRIAVVGWSKGGVAADWASREWFRSRLVQSDLQFAAHVAFYAWCGEQEAKIELTGAPLLYLSGELDDWSGAQPCVHYADRVKRAGYDARIVVYPGAHHGFDYGGSFHTYLPEATSWVHCVYLARETGFVDSASGTFGAWPDLPGFLSRCSRGGVHVASNARARSQAMEALNEFLKEFLYRNPRTDT